MNTLQDYYTSIGQPLPNLGSRAKIAETFGITGYVGSADQNATLLQKLIQAKPVPTAPVPTASFIGQGGAFGGGGATSSYETYKPVDLSQPTFTTKNIQPLLAGADSTITRYTSPTAGSTLQTTDVSSGVSSLYNYFFGSKPTVATGGSDGIKPTGAIAESIQAGQNTNSNPAIRNGQVVQPAPTPPTPQGQANNNNVQQTQFNNNQSNATRNISSNVTQTNTPTATTNNLQQPSLETNLASIDFQGYTNTSNLDTSIQEVKRRFFEPYIQDLLASKQTLDIENQRYIDTLALETQKSEEEAVKLNASNVGFLDRIAQQSGTGRYTPAQAYGAITQERTRFQSQMRDIKINQAKLIRDANLSNLKEKLNISQKLSETEKSEIQFIQEMKDKELNFQDNLRKYQAEQVKPYITAISQSLQGKSIQEQKAIIERYAGSLNLSPDFIKSSVINLETQKKSAYANIVQGLLTKYPDAQIPTEALYNNDVGAVMNAIRNTSTLYKQNISSNELDLATAREKLAPGTFANAQQLSGTVIQPSDFTQINILRDSLVSAESTGSKDRNGNLPNSPNYDQYQVVGLTIPSGSNKGFQAMGKYQIMPNIWFKLLGGEYSKYNSSSRNAGINKQLEEKFLTSPADQDKLVSLVLAQKLKENGGNVVNTISAYLGKGKVDLATGITNDAYTKKVFSKYLELTGQGGITGSTDPQIAAYSQAIDRGEYKSIDNIPEKYQGAVALYRSKQTSSSGLNEQDKVIKEGLEDNLQNINTVIDSVGGILGLGGANVAGPGRLGRIDIGGLFTGDKSEIAGRLDNIISKGVIKELVDAKKAGATFGAITEKELTLLQQSSSLLASWAKRNSDGKIIAFEVGERAFNEELNKIKSSYIKILEEKYGVSSDKGTFSGNSGVTKSGIGYTIKN
jgi:hypothetical protein